MNCIAFDCNGTLVGNRNSGEVITILKCLSPHYKIIVWSNVGGTFAKKIVDKLGIQQWVSSCREKDDVRPDETILMTVDDDKDFNYSLFNLKV